MLTSCRCRRHFVSGVSLLKSRCIGKSTRTARSVGPWVPRRRTGIINRRVRAADAGRRRLGILFVPGRRIASEGAHLADRYR